MEYSLKNKPDAEIIDIDGRPRLIYKGAVCPYPVNSEDAKETILSGKSAIFNKWANKIEYEASQNAADEVEKSLDKDNSSEDGTRVLINGKWIDGYDEKKEKAEMERYWPRLGSAYRWFVCKHRYPNRPLDEMWKINVGG